MFLWVCQVKLPAAGCGVFLKMLHIFNVSSFGSGGSKDGRWGGAASSIPPPFFFLTWALEVSRGLYCLAGPFWGEGKRGGRKAAQWREEVPCWLALNSLPFPAELQPAGWSVMTLIAPFCRPYPLSFLTRKEGCSGIEKLFSMTRSLK